MDAGVSPGYAKMQNSQWAVWERFCAGIGLDPKLQGVKDPVPFLQIFAHRVRRGDIAIRGKAVRKGTVDSYVRTVGQGIASLGAHDPRHDPYGKTDFRLSRQLRSYDRADPPPERVKPIPVSVLHHLYDRCSRGDARQQCVADLIWIAFYFLMRPGEYCCAGSNNTSEAFRLRDVTFRYRNRTLDAHRDSLTSLHRAEHVALTFTTQKNGVKGEAIGTRRSGHQTGCAVLRILNRVAYLRCRGAPRDIPLASYHDGREWRTVKSADFTQEIRNSIAAIGPSVGLQPHEVSARSLRASGAMALLLAGVDTDIIRIIGRWRSDAMLRYLHVTARTLTHNHARLMHAAGDYDLLAPADDEDT